MGKLVDQVHSAWTRWHTWVHGGPGDDVDIMCGGVWPACGA
jgi:hypothetical protein